MAASGQDLPKDASSTVACLLASGPDGLNDLYDKWAHRYEKDIIELGFSSHMNTAEKMAAVLGSQKEARILDCAAGTGLLGLALQKLGFSNLDALDPSEGMLELAKQKKVYTKFICDFVGTNKLMVEDDTYDAIVTIGSITPNHVTDDCFGELIRITKPGGFVMLAVKESYLDESPTFKDKLERRMQTLHEAEAWRWIKRDVEPNYWKDQPGLLYVFQVV